MHNEVNGCTNCITLNEQCLQLTHEISMLTKKLNKLLEHVFHKKTSSPSVIPSCTQTLSKSTQTVDNLDESSQENKKFQENKNFFISQSRKIFQIIIKSCIT